MFFSSNEKQQQQRVAWPEVPPSLHHRSFEMDHDVKPAPAVSALRPRNTARGITPYMALPARLSQVWINRWTVLLLLLLARILILLSGLNNGLEDAKAQALSACTKVEDIGSTMASMPHYLSVGVNSLAADGITKTVQGLFSMLDMIITAIEALIFFIINFYIGTYVCLIDALVKAMIDGALSAVNGTTNAINDIIGPVTDGVSNLVTSATNELNSLTDAIDKVSGFLGINADIPDISGISDDLAKLKDVKIDASSVTGFLTQAQEKIPDFKEVQNMTQDAISIPFNMVKKLLDNKYGNWSFDQSVFAVADKEALTFCSDNNFITEFFEKLFEIAKLGKTVAIVSLLVLAALACGFMAWLEVKKYRKQQRHAEFLMKAGFDPMDVVYITNRSWTARTGIKISSWFKGEKTQMLVRWCVAYATSLPALFVLSLAVAGFFSCFCQWMILNAVAKEAPALETEVGDFAQHVVVSLEDVSAKWSADANTAILSFQDDINDDIFGWVNTSTTSVNNTLNTFEEYMNKGLREAFQDTFLFDFMSEVVGCVIGNKIDAAQAGLTWINDHAHVTLPLFADDIFSIGANDSLNNDSEMRTFLASPGAVTTDEVSDALNKVTTMVRNSIIQEALVSTGLLLVYIIVILFGIIWAAIDMAQASKVRGDGGGQRYYTGDNREPPSPTVSQARFPDFGPAPESAVREKFTGREFGDEKHPYVRRSKDTIGSPQPRPGYWRASSHGNIVTSSDR